MAYFIAPTSLGIGDLIVCLPAVQALIDTGQETYLVARTVLQQKLISRMVGISGVILESQFIKQDLNPDDIFFNLRDHPLQINFWWGSFLFDHYYPGFKINDILNVICTDFSIDVNFNRLLPLAFKSIPAVQNKIVFLPGTDGPYKCLPKQHWLDLALWYEQQNKEVLMVGEPNNSSAVQELLPHLNWLPTPEITDAIDVISSAQAVVAIDTGLMHLAVHQGIPTIAAYQSDPIFQRTYDKSFSLSARPCDFRCVQASIEYECTKLTYMIDFRYRKWSCFADKNQSCMENILPERVMMIAKARPDLFL